MSMNDIFVDQGRAHRAAGGPLGNILGGIGGVLGGAPFTSQADQGGAFNGGYSNAPNGMIDAANDTIGGKCRLGLIQDRTFVVDPTGKTRIEYDGLAARVAAPVWWLVYVLTFGRMGRLPWSAA